MKPFYLKMLIDELQTELAGLQDSVSPDTKQLVSKGIADLDALKSALIKECGK